MRLLRRFQRPDPAPAPFVVGVARSGTTLMRLMLDAHPELAIPPETHFIPKLIRQHRKADDPVEASLNTITTHRRWPDFNLSEDDLRERLEALSDPSVTNVLRAFYGLYAEREGKPRWGDKSPSYVRGIRRIHRVLPEARFVHLIRDGRDVALSLMDVEWGPSTVPEAAEKWAAGIERARKQSKRVDHYSEVRYEDLVADPVPWLRSVCEFIDLDYTEEMLAYHERAAERMTEVIRDVDVGAGPKLTAADRAKQHQLVSEPPRTDRAERWRTDMEPSDQAEFTRIAGDLLAELGYPRD